MRQPSVKSIKNWLQHLKLVTLYQVQLRHSHTKKWQIRWTNCLQLKYNNNNNNNYYSAWTWQWQFNQQFKATIIKDTIIRKTIEGMLVSSIFLIKVFLPNHKGFFQNKFICNFNYFEHVLVFLMLNRDQIFFLVNRTTIFEFSECWFLATIYICYHYIFAR